MDKSSKKEEELSKVLEHIGVLSSSMNRVVAEVMKLGNRLEGIENRVKKLEKEPQEQQEQESRTRWEEQFEASNQGSKFNFTFDNHPLMQNPSTSWSGNEKSESDEPRPKTPPVGLTTTVVRPKFATYKCLLVGDGGVGKTAFMKRHKNGVFETQYNATVGVVVYPLKFWTNHGPIIFNVWDTAGQERFGGLRDGYYIRSNCAILMFSVTNRQSYYHLKSWHRDVMRVCENIPFCTCGNKVNENKVEVTDDFIEEAIEEEEKRSDGKKRGKAFLPRRYHAISVKGAHNLSDPFLDLAKQLTGVTDLTFVHQPTLQLTKPKNQNVVEPSKQGKKAGIILLPDEDDEW